MTIKRIITIGILLFSYSAISNTAFAINAYAADTPDAIAGAKEGGSTTKGGLSGLAEKLGLGSMSGSNEPLHPDEAFKLSVSAEGNKLNAIWSITPGHYLYREKTKFLIKTPDNASLGTAEFPASKTKHDEYLGNTEVYEHDFSVLVPVNRPSNSPSKEVTVETTYQGCSELTGICYPPQKKTHTITLASLSEPVTSSAMTMTDSIVPAAVEDNTSDGINGIASLGNSNEPLHPDEAFKLSVTAEGNQLKASWKVTPEHYLYREKTKFIVKSPTDALLGEPVFPPSKTKNDEYLGNTEVYQHDFSVVIPVTSQSDEITIETTYQGCSESTGICYPPQKKIHTVKLAALNSSTSTNTTSTDSLPEDVKIQAASATSATSISSENSSAAQLAASTEAALISEQDAIMERITNSSTLGTILMFLLFGLGLALTPCVFPMIPILSGIIAGQGENITTRKAFGLSLAYVIPMALIYAVVGVIAGLGGANLQVVFQNPWVLSAFAFIFVLLSLSMFGFYELQMPSGIQSKLSNISNNQESGSYLGAGIMGVLSALIVGPCVTAPLIAALTYISLTKDAVLGGLSLFALGMGMGIPLIIIGTSAGKLLPKAGAWMDAVKAVFGVLMLAMAIWMLSRIVSPQITMALSAILLIISGIYLKALSPVEEGQSKWAYLWKGVGFILLLFGALQLIGVAGGGKNLLQPLSGISALSSGTSANNNATHGLVFKRIRNIADFNATLAQAKTNNQAVMLDFYADWCVSCIEMEKLTFTDPTVINTLKNVILIQADVTADNDDDKALLKKFGLFGPPTIMFFSPDGVENKAYRKVGFVKADKFNADAAGFLKGLNLQ
ncbi:MAG: protein-disulfide reductase DsbD [Thiotrichaceae bacterium]